MHAGYSAQDVDALLDEVAAGLSEDAGAGSDPVVTQQSALIEPRTGFLARIFGR